MSLPVTFFYPYPEELRELKEWDLESHRSWSVEGQERRRAWIVQTYRWLKHFGYEVRISATLPSEGVLVFIPEAASYEALTAQFSKRHRALILVAVRADVVEYRLPLADIEIVQNGRFADERRSFFIPHWPQPGIIPRDSARGATIQNITFKGGFGSLSPEFRSEAWNRFLASRELNFEIASKHTQGTIPRWHDYETADLALAVRPLFNDGGYRCEKPASKLVNAWHAAVPAIVGQEYAFRELRQDPLDFIEVESAQEAMQAIDALIASPDRYEAMIAHGKHRAQQFTPKRIAERWANVLLQEIPKSLSGAERGLRKHSPLFMRKIQNVATSPPSLFEMRKIAGALYRRFIPS